MKDSLRAKWSELCDYVKTLQDAYPKRDIWWLIKDNPITPEIIDTLVNDGLKVDTEGRHVCVLDSGSYSPKTGVSLKKELNGYKRDRILFHEVAHAWYGKETYDVQVPEPRRTEKEAITDWVARKCRANPDLLRHTLLSFGLGFHVYDKTSYQAAFRDVEPEKQLVFPFVKEYSGMLNILMDAA